MSGDGRRGKGTLEKGGGYSPAHKLVLLGFACDLGDTAGIVTTLVAAAVVCPGAQIMDLQASSG